MIILVACMMLGPVIIENVKLYIEFTLQSIRLIMLACI